MKKKGKEKNNKLEFLLRLEFLLAQTCGVTGMKIAVPYAPLIISIS